MPRYKVMHGTVHAHGQLFRTGGVLELPDNVTAETYGHGRLVRVRDDETIRARPQLNPDPTTVKAQEAEGIVPPDAQLAASEGVDDETVSAILGGLGRLEDDNDEHWTQAGTPDLNALSALAGLRVTRRMLDEIAPERMRRSETPE